MPATTKTTTRSSPTKTGRLSDIARHVVAPSGLATTGWPAVRAKCAGLGIEFDPWQDGAGRLILAKRADGSYAASVGGVVISIPRQVGKTFLIGAIVFALCLLNPGLTVLWTAHRLRTANETFAKMQSFARRRKVKPFVSKVTLGSGEGAIQFHNGSRILFGARERGFGRGFDDVGLEVFDEAQILTENAIDDMIPAMNTAANPLAIFLGTPPKSSDPSDVFRGKRSKALSGKSGDIALIEFGADPDADPDDHAQWSKGNPSYPQRTPAAAMMRMREHLTDESFMREALGIWDSTGSGRIIDEGPWSLVADEASMAVDRLALAVCVAPDRSKSSVGFSGKRFDQLWHVEMYEQKAGTGWVVPYVAERCELNAIRAVVADPASPAGSLFEEFAAAGIRLTLPTNRQVAAACGRFYDGVMGDPATDEPEDEDESDEAVVEHEPWLRHTDQHQVNDALTVARKKPAGGGWVWNPQNATSDITPIEVVTLALWGAQTKDVKRPMARRRGTERTGRRAVVL